MTRGVDRHVLLDAARKAVDLLVSPVMHERAARLKDHRPWPRPAGSWLMAQTWVDLLFAHWSVSPEAVRAAVPSPLTLDTFDGRAWIGVTPFEVRNLRLRPMLPVPLLSSFPEINVRTYVTFGGKPGIFFFSLDADSTAAVAAARRGYRLPYYGARMSIARSGAAIDYESARRSEEHAAPAAFRARYRGIGAASPPAPGTLEHWLTERYCLYTFDDAQQVLRGQIHHPPWPLQAAEAEIALNTMAGQIGIDLTHDPLLHYAHRQDVVFWTLEPAERAN
jgi:uncharacterized protein